MKKLFTLKLVLLIAFFSFPFSSPAQTTYTLTAADVTVVNGVITSCSYNYAITDIVIPSQINGQTIVGIGASVFDNDNLTTVVFPSTLATIGQAAFRRSRLVSIDLSTAADGLVLEGSVFRQCANITSFTLSANVKQLGQYCFRDATKLENFIFENGNTHMTQILPYDAITRPDATNVPLKNIIISDNIEIITGELFVFATQLETVTFAPNPKLKTIEKDAFPAGKTITLPTPVSPGRTFLYWLKEGQQFAAGSQVSDYSSPYTAFYDGDPVDFTVYVSSSSGNDLNNGLTDSTPVKTLTKAKELIIAEASNLPVKILLKSADVFDDFTFMTNTTIQNDDSDRFRYAFVWDIDRALTFSIYGGTDKAILNGGKFMTPKANDTPQGGFCVSSPSTKNVVVENIHFQNWQTTVFHVLETQNITFQNNKIEKVGTRYFQPELNNAADDYIFSAGVFYVRSGNNIKVLNNEFIDMHNAWSKGPTRPTEQNIEDLHAIYLTRTKNCEVANNKFENSSGSPFKVRRQPDQGDPNNNIHLHDNEFLNTGPSINIANLRSFSQRGWLRYSGELYDDNSANCPQGILIENNKFYYPYCWSEYENCNEAEAQLYSVSNTSVCGDAGSNPSLVTWRNNDIRLKNESLSTEIFQSKESTLRIIHNGSSRVNLLYDIKKPAFTKLEVFDVQGRSVEVLNQQYLTSGNHSIPLEKIGKGLFILKSTIDGKLEVKKLIIP